MNKAGFKKCLQDKVVTEPRKCDSDRGGEHRSLEQEQDLQQLRRGGRNRQKRQHREKSREAGVSMLVCTSSGRHTGGTAHMLGKGVLPRPNYAHEEEMFQKALGTLF